MQVIPDYPKIGPHVCKLSSFEETARKVHNFESVTAFQIFLSGNRRYYTSPVFRQDDVITASKFMKNHGMRMVIHASYVYNLCGSVDLNSEKAVGALQRTCLGIVNELDMAVALGNDKYVPPVVIHTGSCKDLEKRIEIVADSISRILDSVGSLTSLVAKYKGITEEEVKSRRVMCLENAAGEGTKIGSTVEELSQIYNHSNLSKSHRKRLCFCIDTAHLYGAGKYDFGKVEHIREFVKEWKSTMPLENIRVIHYNDSIAEFGSRKDRHELLGCGYMLDPDSQESLEAIAEVIKLLDSELKECCVILEPPRPCEPGLEWFWKIRSECL